MGCERVLPCNDLTVSEATLKVDVAGLSLPDVGHMCSGPSPGRPDSRFGGEVVLQEGEIRGTPAHCRWVGRDWPLQS